MRDLESILIPFPDKTHPHLHPPLEGEEADYSPPSRGRLRGGWVYRGMFEYSRFLKPFHGMNTEFRWREIVVP
jgi:hypothetical protein